MPTTIQFSHANGFAAKTYSYFLKQLHPHPVSYVERLGHGQFPVKRHWQEIADELIHHIEQHQTEKVIGLGHSLGAAATLIAANKRPDLFERVIIIEPPIFGLKMRWLVWFFRLIGKGEHSMVTRTRKRQRIFESREAAYNKFKTKRLFKSFDDNCLWDYVNYGLKDTKNGVELIFSPDIEAEIFKTNPTKLGNIQLKMPATYIYSSQYKTLKKGDIDWWKKTYKEQINFIEFDGGHMFPLEQPKATAALIKAIIDGKR